MACCSRPSTFRLPLLAALLGFVGGLTVSTRAETITFGASKDNTLYQPILAGATNSNGMGRDLFAGRTDDGYLRRAALRFDVTNFIPAGALITGVTMTLNLTRTRDPGSEVTLHRILADWGEGGSNAIMEEGIGTQAALGDVTWFHRFYPTNFWSTPGGDFSATASAGIILTDHLGPFSWSSPGLIADVQFWLDNPGMNFGWLVKGTEATTKTAKRMDSREAMTTTARPTLRVEFLPMPKLTSIRLDGPDVLLRFSTVPNLLHTLERRDDFTIGPWTPLTNDLLGTGKEFVITNTGAATLPRGCYRIGVFQR